MLPGCSLVVSSRFSSRYGSAATSSSLSGTIRSPTSLKLNVSSQETRSTARTCRRRILRSSSGSRRFRTVLANHRPLAAIVWFRFLVLFMLGGSTAWCASLLKRSGKLASGIAVAFYSLSIIAVGLSIKAYDLGQREQLLLIFLLPYLLAVGTGVAARLSTAERCALGLAAGCAIWFKPQDVLIVVALEVVCALRDRSLRRLLSLDFIVMVLTASVLFVLVLVLTPPYVHQVVPLLSDVYWGLGTNTALSLLLGSPLYLLEVAVFLLCYAALRSRLSDRTTPLALLAESLAAFVAYAIQHTTWPYHRYPHEAIFLLAVAYLVLDLLQPWLRRFEKVSLFHGPAALAISGCVLVLTLIVALHPAVARYHRHPFPATPLDLFLAQQKPGTSVSALSTQVTVLAAVYDHELTWGSRFAHLWMMPAIIQNEMGRNSPSSPYKQLSPQTLTRLATLQRQQVAEDLSYWHPDLVLVPHCTLHQPCQGMEGKNIDLVAWFKRSSDFATVWSNYQQQPGPEGYDVYRRIHSAGLSPIDHHYTPKLALSVR